jgi:Kef-type K+ transport system membrane component KefB
LTDLLLVFVAAKVAGELFLRLGQPPVIGELLVGVAIGPYVLGLIGRPDPEVVELFHHDPAMAAEAVHLSLEVVAEVGVVVLLFFVGLETRLDDMLRVGWRAAVVGALGVALPFVAGTGMMLALGEPAVESLFIGVALVATSVGITARVLRDLGVLGAREARIILGAAVIDDILGLLMLTIVSGIGRSGQVRVGQVITIAMLALVFTVVVGLGGTWAARRWFHLARRLRVDSAPVVASLVLMLGLAVLAASIGLAAIVGAFLAGMMLSEIAEEYGLERRIQALYDFLVPFFFVVTGSFVDPRIFLQRETLGLAALVSAVAIVTKAVGAGLGSLGLGLRSLAVIGVGMVPRGEVGLIVASIGLSMGVIQHRLFSVVVVMAVVTTLIVPPVLTWLLRPLARRSLEATAEAASPADS